MSLIILWRRCSTLSVSLASGIGSLRPVYAEYACRYSGLCRLQQVFLQLGYAVFLLVFVATFQAVFSLAGNFCPIFEWCFARLLWLRCSVYVQTFEYHVVQRALAFTITYAKTLVRLRPRGHGSSVVIGAPGPLSARCSVHSFPFCPSKIDPFGRAVPCEPNMDRLVMGTQPVMPTCMPSGMGTLRTEDVGSSPQENQDLSVLGEDFKSTRLVIPIRAHLDSVERLLNGDVYIGRGSRQRALPKSRYCNNFKVSKVGPDAAIAGFRDAFFRHKILHASLWTLSCTRLVCHCRAGERCHGDVLIDEFRRTK